MSAFLMSETEEQSDKENIHQVKQTVPIHGKNPAERLIASKNHEKCAC